MKKENIPCSLQKIMINQVKILTKTEIYTSRYINSQMEIQKKLIEKKYTYLLYYLKGKLCSLVLEKKKKKTEKHQLYDTKLFFLRTEYFCISTNKTKILLKVRQKPGKLFF